MKKMTIDDMRHVNGGFWGAAVVGWLIGRGIGKTIAKWRGY